MKGAPFVKPLGDESREQPYRRGKAVAQAAHWEPRHGGRSHNNPFAEQQQQAIDAPGDRGKQTIPKVVRPDLVYPSASSCGGDALNGRVDTGARQFEQADMNCLPGPPPSKPRGRKPSFAPYAQQTDPDSARNAHQQQQHRLRRRQSDSEDYLRKLHPGDDLRKDQSAAAMSSAPSMVDRMLSQQFPVPHGAQAPELPPIHTKHSPRKHDSSIALVLQQEPRRPVVGEPQSQQRPVTPPRSGRRIVPQPTSSRAYDEDFRPGKRLVPRGEVLSNVGMNPVTGLPLPVAR